MFDRDIIDQSLNVLNCKEEQYDVRNVNDKIVNKVWSVSFEVIG